MYNRQEKGHMLTQADTHNNDLFEKTHPSAEPYITDTDQPCADATNENREDTEVPKISAILGEG